MRLPVIAILALVAASAAVADDLPEPAASAPASAEQAAVAPASTESAEGTTKLEPGSPAPDFTLSRPDGGTFRLHEAMRQGPVVLVFFRGAW